MKIQKKIAATWSIQITMTIMFVLLAVNVQAASFKVDLDVSADGSALVITNEQTGDKKCPASMVPPPVKGCLYVKDRAIFRTAHITFELNTTVTCGPSGNGNWVLRDVYLGGEGAGKPAAPADWGNLSKEVQGDFDVDNPVTGLLTPENRSDKKLKIKDKNDSKFTIWYKVVAACMDGDTQIGEPIETDPRIDNEGKL